MNDNEINVKITADGRQVASGVDQAKAPLRSLDPLLRELMADFKALAADIKQGMVASAGFTEGFVTELKRLQREARDSYQAVEGIGKSASIAGTAIRGFVAGFVTTFAASAVENALEFASALGEQAQQLGVTTRELQVYRYAASQVGIANDEMDKGLARLTLRIGQAAGGNKEMATLFHGLGIAVTDASGHTRKAGDVFEDLADHLAKIPDPAKRAEIEVALFGKTGQQLDTLLAGGSAAIQQLASDAARLGLVLDEKLIGQADDAADKLSTMKRVLQVQFAAIVAENAQAFRDLADAIMGATKKLGEFFTTMRGFAKMQRDEGPWSAFFNPSSGWDWSNQLAAADPMKYVKLRGDQLNAAKAELARLDKLLPAGISPSARAAQLRTAEEAVQRARWLWVQAMADPDYAAVTNGTKPAPKPTGPSALASTDTAAHGGSAKSTPSLTQQWKTELADLLAAEQNWGADDLQLSLKFWEQKAALTAKGSKEELEVRREVARLRLAIFKQGQTEEIAAIKQRLALEQDLAKTEIEIGRTALQHKLNDIDAEEQAGRLSSVRAAALKAEVNRQLYQLDLEQEERTFALKMRAWQEQLALAHLDVKTREQINREIELLEAEHLNRMALLKKQIDLKQAKDDEELTALRRRQHASIANSWAGEIAKMVTLQQGFMTTIRNSYLSLVGIFAQVVQNMVRNWLMGLLANESASKTFHAKQILMDAKAAAAGAWKATVGIPIVGPILAPIAAAAAFGGVMAFSAEKGAWSVPSDNQPFFLHKEEMVLPANLARPLRSIIEGPAAANLNVPSPRNDQVPPSVTINIPINAIDSMDARRWIHNNKGEIAAAVDRAVRDGYRRQF